MQFDKWLFSAHGEKKTKTKKTAVLTTSESALLRFEFSGSWCSYFSLWIFADFPSPVFLNCRFLFSKRQRHHVIFMGPPITQGMEESSKLYKESWKMVGVYWQQLAAEIGRLLKSSPKVLLTVKYFCWKMLYYYRGRVKEFLPLGGSRFLWEEGIDLLWCSLRTLSLLPSPPASCLAMFPCQNSFVFLCYGWRNNF